MFNKFNLIILFFLFFSGCSNLSFNEQNLVIYFNKADKELLFYLEKGMKVANSCETANICIEVKKIRQLSNSVAYPTSGIEEEILVLIAEIEFYKLDENKEKIIIAERKVEEYANYIVDENFHIAGDYEAEKATKKVKQNLARQINDLAYRYAN